MGQGTQETPSKQPWRSIFTRKSKGVQDPREKRGDSRWALGILEDKKTIEVPGSVLLLASDHNEPLGLRNAPARTSHSSIPTGVHRQVPDETVESPKKKTRDGKIILDPQPEESANDPLNWPAWRRDLALLSLGLFCMVGGGTTPLLAAGFTDVAEEYGVSVHSVSLTTGLYMMGMGLGSVIFSPTAILWGKRPVYLFGAVVYIATSIWCASSPNFISLVLARIFQGIAVSPVECLPSATIAEIFFLHERAFRIGIYTLLLLGGKNLVPLVSAVIIQNMGWRWVFWVVAIVVGFCGLLLFFFVPETFWDRHPVPRKTKSRPNFFRRLSSKPDVLQAKRPSAAQPLTEQAVDGPVSPGGRPKAHHVGFAPDLETDIAKNADASSESTGQSAQEAVPDKEADTGNQAHSGHEPASPQVRFPTTATRPPPPERLPSETRSLGPASSRREHFDTDTESQSIRSAGPVPYTAALREQPARSFVQSLKPFNGRLNKDKWHKVVVRPLILFSYPAVLWSAVVYSCSIGWLIVISESVAVIYREGAYNFNALQTGLVYISPFVGGILGSAVAGRVSDMIVKSMARRNGGLYEPEYRLVMAIPIAITTVIGLMGFGWSAQVHDHWMVPTAFFGIISFGCTMGSTTSITFCVDSYRQYAGEALVTLNFSKNVLHGLVFSLFVTGWLDDDGPKTVYIWIGIIQLILLLFTIPMYIFGKRLRMWTVRRNFMERF
ncbi:major facilitator superfamily domain-containing protein [Chaetomium strumarium]|uniref:Major facilitator superfamily domain-containing protein n=1 Tax=Chaetomium strumarium TaxID=1170767 RepID=A0AAJ0H427_9PEZI|nr:major facilitator superfamily domain-containing protein [Chaetomium strumarium]